MPNTKLILDKIETLNFIIETFQIPSETCILKPGTGGGVGFGMPLCMAHRILDKMAAKIGASSGANQTKTAPCFQLTSELPVKPEAVVSVMTLNVEL